MPRTTRVENVSLATIVVFNFLTFCFCVSLFVLGSCSPASNKSYESSMNSKKPLCFNNTESGKYNQHQFTDISSDQGCYLKTEIGYVKRYINPGWDRLGKNIVVCSNNTKEVVPRLKKFVDTILPDKEVNILDGTQSLDVGEEKKISFLYYGNDDEAAVSKCVSKYTRLKNAVEKFSKRNTSDELKKRNLGFDQLGPDNCASFARYDENLNIYDFVQYSYIDEKECFFDLAISIFDITITECPDSEGCSALKSKFK